MKQDEKASHQAGEKYVFVSYAHSDKSEVEPVMEILREWGVKIFWDKRIYPGSAWQEELASAIHDAHLFIAMVTPNYAKSKYCRRELHYAMTCNSHLLAIHLKPTNSQGLEFALGNTQAILKDQLTDSQFEDQLAAGVSEIMHRERHSTQKRSKFSVQRKLVLGLIMTLLFISSTVLVIKQTSKIDPAVKSSTEPKQLLDSFSPPSNSVAVMPFTNIGDDKSNQYFSDGMTEEILNSLANIDGLLVTARTSAFMINNRSLDIKTLGRELNVSRILRGSVRRAGDQLRISIQLFNAQDGFHVWSESFDRNIQQVFEVQSEIASVVADLMEVRFEEEDSAQAVGLSDSDIEAYDLYLMGRHRMNQRSIESIEEGIGFFEQALNISPNLVYALSGLADSYFLLQTYGSLSVTEAARKMRPLLVRAFELDNKNEVVLTSLGAMHRILGEFEEAESAFENAIKLNQNYAVAHMWLGNLKVNQNRLLDASRHYEIAFKLDPLNVAVMLNVIRIKMWQGHPVDAFNLMDRLMVVHPDNPLAMNQHAHWLNTYGKEFLAIQESLRSLAVDSSNVANLNTLGNIYLKVAAFTESQIILERALEIAPDNKGTIWMKSYFYLYNKEFVDLDLYLQTKLDLSEDGRDAERKTLNLWAGVSKLYLSEYNEAERYFEAALNENVPYQFPAPVELMFRSWQVLAYRLAENYPEAKQAIESANDFIDFTLAQSWGGPDFFARVAGFRAIEGKHQESMELLTQAVENGFNDYQLLNLDLSFDSLRKLQEFQNLVNTITNRVSATRSSIRNGGDIDLRLKVYFEIE